jgi:hypothetical protein
MNTGISVAANPVYDGDIGLGQTAPLMAAFTVGGLILLYAAVRLIRRRRPHAQPHHADRYTVHRH